MASKRSTSKLATWAETFTSRHAPFLQPLWFGFLSVRWVIMGALILVLAVTTKRSMAAPDAECAHEPVAALPEASEVQFTTDGGTSAAFLSRLTMANLPPPGKGQVNEESACESPARWLEGGCWLLVGEEVPPCAPRNGKPRRMWPHEGKCWMPVPRTARVLPPTSGDPRSSGVAEP